MFRNVSEGKFSHICIAITILRIFNPLLDCLPLNLEHSPGLLGGMCYDRRGCEESEHDVAALRFIRGREVTGEKWFQSPRGHDPGIAVIGDH